MTIRNQLRRKEIHLAVRAIGLPDFDSVVHLARTAERGLFDFIVHDEPTVLSALAAVTERLGLVGIVDTEVTEPFGVARQLATLDHLSNGRSGWLVEHGDRDERAAEFEAVARAFWDSWEPTAVLADVATGTYADADRIHPVDHRGSQLNVRGYATLPAGPQGHPVLLQTGDAAGRELDAGPVDAIVVPHLTPTVARPRNPLQPKIFAVAPLRQFAGTAAQVAAEIDLHVQSDDCDGFILVPPPVPHGLDEFVESVVPLLQERGAFRAAYPGTTLREYLRS